MIETINLGGREIDLCINAASQTLPEERRPWLYVNKRLSALKKKYYLESEGFIFFDEGKAISIAAQVVQWIHTDIQAGKHYIFLPFDNIVYVATIRVQQSYILVEKEDLLAFEDCVELIRSNPLECQVAKLGNLSAAFAQHNIALKDLHINLEPGENNPFLLQRGYNLAQLFLLALGPCIGAGLVFLLISTLATRKAEEAVPVTVPTKPESTVQVAADLTTVAALLGEFSVLLAYDLDNISIDKTPGGYLTRATGRYNQSFSLSRLHRIAARLAGSLALQKGDWSLNSFPFKPPPGNTAELVPLATSLEQYRQFAAAGNARFSIISSNRKDGAVQGIIELSIDYPNYHTLQRWGRQLQRVDLHGYLRNARITTGRNSGWQNLTATIAIIGH